MIGRLVGEIIHKKPPQVLLDVQGVGYEVDAPMTTFYDLPEVGERTVLLTHLIVREDAQLLYGFSSESERSMFRHLIRINGVGPKLALTILSGMSGSELARCVHDNNVTALVKLPGVGKKTAERLIVELKDRLKELVAAVGQADVSTEVSFQPPAASPLEEAVSALVALGYKPPEATRMVRSIESAELGSEDIIRQALQAAAKGRA